MAHPGRRLGTNRGIAAPGAIAHKRRKAPCARTEVHGRHTLRDEQWVSMEIVASTNGRRQYGTSEIPGMARGGGVRQDPPRRNPHRGIIEA